MSCVSKDIQKQCHIQTQNSGQPLWVPTNIPQERSREDLFHNFPIYRLIRHILRISVVIVLYLHHHPRHSAEVNVPKFLLDEAPKNAPCLLY